VNRKTNLALLIIAVALVVSAYPAFILGYTWSYVACADLPGGRDGPLDAYRHTLASAAVAFTLGPRVVEWTTWAAERSDNPGNLMDRHNNQIGAVIGSNAHRFSDIEPTVRAQVLHGTVNATDRLQVTWLPPERWRRAWLW
jgi:hypothetical protein